VRCVTHGNGTAPRRARTKTLSWNDRDETALRTLRAQIAATFGQVWSERDVVAAAIRVALANPAALGPARPAA
jgi:hypothetical protein